MTTVLVATERELEFNVLSQTLAGRGYSLVRTKDGIEALDAIRTHQPEVLLANVVLPKLDGFSLYRRCQQDEQLRRVPMVLFSTRSNDQKSERFAAELGIPHFVGNALKSEQLGEAIEAARTSKPEPLPAVALAPRPARTESVAAETPAVPASVTDHDTQQSEQRPPAAVEASDKTIYMAAISKDDREEAERQHWLHEQSRQLDTLRQAQTQIEQLRGDSELFALSPAAMWIVDKTSQRMLGVNNAALKLFGYERNDFMQLGADALFKSTDAHGATQVKTFQSKDGRALSLILGAHDLTYAGKRAELFSAHDVSYRVRGERAMADELRRQRVLLAAVPLPYLLLNGVNRVLDTNELCIRKLGYRREQLLEADFTSLLAEAEHAALEQQIAQHATLNIRFKLATGGEWRAEALVSRVDMTGDVRMLLLRDLPVKAEPESDTAPRKLPAVLEMLRYAEDADESTLLHYAMAQLAQTFECPLAMFGAIERVTQSLQILAIKQTPAPRTQPEINATVRAPAPWSGLFANSGVHAEQVTDEAMLMTGLPEINSYVACSVPGSGRDEKGRPAWLLVLANRDSEFSVVEQQELRECAEVLVALLARKRAQFKVQATQQRQAASIDGMVTLIERLIDAQDVYAAGSGRRVAALATNIARHLNLPEERITALNIAARLHDVGHLALPRELFLLPRPLNHSERALVKTHIEQGSRLLRTVDFGMEVASIVAQHHERLDGSGYPAGAKGEQISQEARILAVADVADAITTARAHRPAQDLSAALAELRAGSGSRYDGAIVSACERIFTDLNGQWPV